jgi:hypothetical protein
MTPCPECERNKFRAAMWRAEAYKQAGHDKIERPWVGLTDEEKRQIVLDDPIDWVAAIEAKLKEKNETS